MKILLSLLLLLYLPVSVFGQNVVLANDKMNVAYAGIPNPITIAVENYKADQVIVSTDNGTLVSKGNSHYDYTPLNAGKAVIKIEVKTKNGNKKIGQAVYRIKAIPTPIAGFDNKTTCFNMHYRAKGLIAKIDNFDFDIKFEITDFKLQITSKDSIISTTIIKGATFPANIFDSMKVKDRIFITEIHCIGPDKRIQTLNPIVYTFN